MCRINVPDVKHLHFPFIEKTFAHKLHHVHEYIPQPYSENIHKIQQF